nr:HNH endonuclease signature motif containing protein [Vibrio breoganii]
MRNVGYIHHQPKKDNRRWGFRRNDFPHESTAWVEPRVSSNQFIVAPTGEFRRFSSALEAMSQRVRQDQNRTVYYFQLAQAKDVFATFCFSATEEANSDDMQIDTPTSEQVKLELEEAIKHSFKDTPDNRKKRLLSSNKRPKKIQTTTHIFKRNPDVIVEVLLRADGICERCQQKAPFIRGRGGTPYLEVHHIKRLADGGDDSIENAQALCPNCHRELHFG